MPENGCGDDDEKAGEGFWRRCRRAAVPAFRVLCVLILINGLCGLAACLGPGATPLDLAGELVHGDLVHLLLTPHDPRELLGGIGRAPVVTSLLLLAGTGVLLGLALAMRPGAVLGLVLAALLLLLTLRESI